MKSSVLLIADDPKTAAAVKEALGKGYGIEVVKSAEEAAAQMAKNTPDLLLIDFDIKVKDGLQIYRELRPKIKVIMLSASGNIPLAVSATKQGVVDFLRKPIDGEELRSAVEKNILSVERRMAWPDGAGWLLGESRRVRDFIRVLEEAVDEGKDILISKEPGIPLHEAAAFIHLNGGQNEKRLFELDLLSFISENQEAHFWANIHAIMSRPGTSSLKREEDLCGTLYLDNIDRIEPNFRASVLDYFKSAQRDFLVVYGCRDEGFKIEGALSASAPRLRERKEDLPFLLEFYLGEAAVKFNKPVRFISSDLLEFLASYDFPGNYVELKRMLEEAVLNSSGDKLEAKNFPISNRGLVNVALKQALGRDLTLQAARKKYEKKLLGVLMEKTGGEDAAVARFVDLPRSRVKDLLD